MLQGWNLQEWTNQHDVARVDIAGVDNAAPLWQGWTMQEWSEVTKAVGLFAPVTQSATLLVL